MSPEDLFGSALPAGYNPSEKLPSTPRRHRPHTVQDEIGQVLDHGTAEHGGGRVKRPKLPNFCPHAERMWTERGYVFRRVDKTVSWCMRTLDWLGLYDAEAEKPGEPKVWIQVCAKSSRSAHLRKMTSGTEVHRQAGGGTRLGNLRACLDRGERVVLMQFHQPGGRGTRWMCDEEDVTPELVEAFLSRKRGQHTRIEAGEATA